MDQPTAPSPAIAPAPADTQAKPDLGAPAPDTSERFRAKRDRILDAASEIINERGLRGLTFVSVADRVGMNTTSITYYFRRKEILAAAALERTIEQISTMAQTAAEEPTVEARIDKMLAQVLAQYRAEVDGTASPLARLSDMRSLAEPLNQTLYDSYLAMFRQIVGFYSGNDTAQGRARNWVRTHILLDTLHWCRVWIAKYSVADYPRVHARMMELFRNGYAPDGVTGHSQPLQVPSSTTDTDEINHDTYLRAATITLNERGYRGASVERIAAHLNLSKGSFYHHLDGKDDLVTDCFDRSYTRISLTQRAAMALDGTWLDRITAATHALTNVQFEAVFPLLRVTALMALPTELRTPILTRSDRITQRFAGMLTDGITEGSIRPIDPTIAAHCLFASLNSAYDFRVWAEHRPDRDTAVRLYSDVLAHGMID
ncbi:TetR/AcrR family transcriptional regulator [Pseudooceanicola sp. MF1-13]|uniref:TetR/AcrR family transcriptional regulator n=1 Tax=Pseudooceanicola sp. MF1-13 TaxID=3379095 RepID=UPI0038912348